MATGELGHDNLDRALRGFVDLLEFNIADLPAIARDGVENGRIQKFEYCAELFWKHLRSCLLAEGLDVANSPRGTIKAGLDRGFVLEAEYQPALDLIADRNTCSHVYKQSLIPGVLERLPAHARLMQSIFVRLSTP